MRIINKVPHELTIITADGAEILFPKAVNPIRVEIQKLTNTATIFGRDFPIMKEIVTPRAKKKLVEELDEVLEGNYNFVILSRLAHENVPAHYVHLERILSPGHLIRDSGRGGEVIGALGFNVRNIDMLPVFIPNNRSDYLEKVPV